jgi:hypothetical protein
LNSTAAFRSRIFASFTTRGMGGARALVDDLPSTISESSMDRDLLLDLHELGVDGLPSASATIVMP